ncbi:MAG: phosphatidate cytidylyltransferase [Bacillota bacterium]
MLALRVATAIIGGPAVLLAAWWGGIPLVAFCLMVSAAGIEEMSNMLALKGIGVSRPVAHALQVVCLSLFYYNDVTLWCLFPAAAAIVTLSIPVFGRRWSEIPRAGATLLAVMYIPYLLGHLILIRNLPGGGRMVVFALAITWATDTAAYFAGTRLGRRKLCPELSPKKSWEGAAAGLAAGTAIACLLGPWVGVTVTAAAAVGLAASFLAEVGDLFESALKRYTGVKDSGRIIPGHGGALDRFDSLLFSAPVVYWLIRLIKL